MEWIKTSDKLPPMVKDGLDCSDLVLCQDCNFNTWLGYVLYDSYNGLKPKWIQQGRDMYSLRNIVRWVDLSDVTKNISEFSS